MTDTIESSETGAALWVPGTVTISCAAGAVDVPSLTHPLCPGIAVTMSNFGTFRVSHVHSGLVIGGAYERAASAVLELTEWEAIARAYGFTFDAPGSDTVRDAILACQREPVPFGDATSSDATGTRPLTVREWAQLVRGNEIGDEFPWEGDNPWDEADVLLATFAAAPQNAHERTIRQQP